MDITKSCKYALDRFFAVILLVLIAPLLLVIGIAIRLESPGSPVFLQERVGEGGKNFTIFKFRTMRTGSEREGMGVTTASEDERITRLGRILRTLSLDELPQLLNIALGEMSFIGPRPTLRYQVESYTRRQARRLLFRPGITGWAQVNGRNSIPWAARIELDLEYIDNYSLWLDIRILWRTLVVLLRRDGVYTGVGSANDTFVSDATASTASDESSLSADLDAPDAQGIAEVPPSDTTQSDGLTPLLIIGAGGHARVVIDVIEKQGIYSVFGLIDQRHAEIGGELMGYPVLGGREILDEAEVPPRAFVAIGSPADREAWQNYLEARGIALPILIHPAAVVGRGAQIGAGSVLMPGSIVNVGCSVGRGVIINTGASVDHDCEVADFVHVAPGARLAGSVRVGTRSHIGIGACVIQGVTIEPNSIVGAGAAVLHDVPEGQTVVGVPARRLSKSRSPKRPTPITTSA